MYKKHRKYYLLLLTFSVFSETSSQCSMCRAQLESLEDGSVAQAVNDGIVFLMAVPYVLVAIMGFIIYKKFIQKNK